MSSFNKIILIGNLGKDPEIKTGEKDGKPYTLCRFNIAVNRPYPKDAPPDWFGVMVWNKTAELCERFLIKGSSILVEGSIEINKWTDKETQEEKSKPVVRARRVVFLSNLKEGDQGEREGGEPWPQDDEQQPF